MGRAWAHRIVAFAFALAAWVVARPALAAAPLCDPRGAVTFAPAPQLQAPLASVDIGTDRDGCSAALGKDPMISRGEAPNVAAPMAEFIATLPAALSVAQAPNARVDRPDVGPPFRARAASAPPDRPPRA
jgi:hypothetical protein